MPLLLFLLFLRAILAPAIRRTEHAVMLLSNKHFPAIFAHVDRIIRIREHKAEYQRDRQHQGTPGAMGGAPARHPPISAAPPFTTIMMGFSTTIPGRAAWSGSKYFCRPWPLLHGRTGKPCGTQWKQQRRNSCAAASMRHREKSSRKRCVWSDDVPLGQFYGRG